MKISFKFSVFLFLSIVSDQARLDEVFYFSSWALEAFLILCFIFLYNSNYK